MQPFTAELARERFEPLAEPTTVSGAAYRVLFDDAGGRFVEEGADGERGYPIAQALGGKNVFYLLTPMERGRLQVLPLAFDVNAGEWFDTAASASRHFPGIDNEALDWRHPAYTFNTSCHGCHVSQLSTNYDLESDTYRTTWKEPGINCETCHGPAEEHNRIFREAAEGEVPEDPKIISTSNFNVQENNDSCATCHAKGMPLSTDFMPGDRFFDHFDLVTLEHPDFYPDGRDLGENYTQTTWLLSPCVQSGQLSCVHCHTSSGRFRQAHDPDQACAPCHADKVDNPAAHGRHEPGSEGNRCVGCHMPATWFARMERHDHSMLPPTPQATLAFGSPNACNVCHGDEEAAWADRWAKEWRGADYQEAKMRDARLIDEARRGEWDRLPEMIDSIRAETANEVITTSLVRLLRQCEDDAKWAVFEKAARDRSPLVRAAAAEALGDRLTPEAIEALVGATRDEYRLVRVRAAAALAPVPQQALREEWRASVRGATTEFLDTLQARPDDAYSHFNLGNFHVNRGDAGEAIKSFETATRLRPDLVAPLANLGQVYAVVGRPREAEEALRQALALEPANAAVLFNLGLFLGEQGRLDEAAESHRAALDADPEMAQAAYNLGVILAEKKPREGLRWCRRAAELRPGEPNYAYTVGFYEERNGEAAAAVRTLETLVGRHPAYADAYLLLGSIYERQGRAEAARALYTKALEDADLNRRQEYQVASRLQALGQAAAD
jgi:tetratricopeptide (TPR) repeat protein